MVKVLVVLAMPKEMGNAWVPYLNPQAYMKTAFHTTLEYRDPH